MARMVTSLMGHLVGVPHCPPPTGEGKAVVDRDEYERGEGCGLASGEISGSDLSGPYHHIVIMQRIRVLMQVMI